MWKQFLTYPHQCRTETVELLDAAETLIIPPFTNDRYVDMADWLSQLRSAGIITGRELGDLRYDIANNI